MKSRHVDMEARGWSQEHAGPTWSEAGLEKGLASMPGGYEGVGTVDY